jgi:MFS family permease
LGGGAGSALCGAAWSIDSLIAFRILQGLGGGMLLPLAQTILTQAAGPENRMRIMPFVAVPAQLAPIVGPVIGGLLLGHASWRWIFYVNVPVCLFAIAIAWRGMPRTEVRGEHRLDVRGLSLLSPALALVVYVVLGGRQGRRLRHRKRPAPARRRRRAAVRVRGARAARASSRSSTCGCCACAASRRRPR